MKRQAMVVGVAGVALLVLYALLRPGQEAPAGSAVSAAPGVRAASAALPASPASPASAPGPVVLLNVDAPAGTQLTAQLRDVLLLEVRSAKAGALQAHGLVDQDFPIGTGTTRIALPAAALGSFALHFHGAHLEHASLATLAVLPR